MIDKNKIILMTKLAIYEKNNMKRDNKKIDYYLEDYVYINNFKTRISITIMVAIIAVVGSIVQFSETLVFPMSLEELIAEYLVVYIAPWLILMVIYTFISTIVYSKRYYKSQKNHRDYMNLIKQLDKYETAKRNKEGA